MSFNIDPPTAQFPAIGGESIHHLINTGETRLAFKVKSSNNEHYRVRPVYGFIEVGGTTSINIVRLEGPPKEDKFVVLWAEVPIEEEDPKAPFVAGAEGGEVILLAKSE